jgi:hypothetical protein
VCEKDPNATSQIFYDGYRIMAPQIRRRTTSRKHKGGEEMDGRAPSLRDWGNDNRFVTLRCPVQNAQVINFPTKNSEAFEFQPLQKSNAGNTIPSLLRGINGQPVSYELAAKAPNYQSTKIEEVGLPEIQQFRNDKSQVVSSTSTTQGLPKGTTLPSIPWATRVATGGVRRAKKPAKKATSKTAKPVKAKPTARRTTKKAKPAAKPKRRA